MSLWGLLLLAQLGWAQQPPSDDAPGSAGFSVALERAKEAYFNGGHEDARRLLEELAVQARALDTLDKDDVAEALTYLGEIQYMSGDQAASWDTFRELLLRDPARNISPYHHPNDVVAWFELVRRQVLQDLREQQEKPPPDKPPPLPPPRLEWTAYAPLGIPQLAGGRPWRGAAYGVGQLSLAAVSISAYSFTARNNHADLWDRQATRRDRVVAMKWGVEWPATLGFYGLWALSHVDERQHVRQAPRAQATLTAGREHVVFTVTKAF